MAEDHFLSRWARRKREALQEEVLQEKAPSQKSVVRESGQMPAIPAEHGSPGVIQGEAVEEAALIEDVVADLPSLDSLTADTDLTQFLRAGVPQALRNAAMRRMWSLDPSIRDYLCEAREYAFDWHIPGAVPGTGPILPTDDIAGMVREIFDGSRPLAGPPASEDPADHAQTPLAELADETVLPTPATGRESEAAPQPLPAAATEPRLPSPVQAMPGEAPSPELVAAAVAPATNRTGRLRRHGGASPI